ncbi:MAG TPA: transcription termination/antitermination protein NusG [Chitinophagaceae bacterium]|nr:transcription termination/antitermination protein NusG [Chitinophagaceae bacterium]
MNDTNPSNNLDQDTKWYVLRIVGGREKKVQEYLKKEIEINRWDTDILQILCPTEKIYKEVGGKKVIRERVLYPGYILLQVKEGKLNGDMISGIQSITNVIHFLGRDNPEALRESEVRKMFGNFDDQEDKGIGVENQYMVGETVKIKDGAFNDFTGTIESISEDGKKLTVIVKIFGRETPVELSFTQVKKES